MAFDDDLAEILASNKRNNINIDTVAHSPTFGEQAGSWLGSMGIGAANMLNNTILGGAGQLLGSLGSITEAISPLSGNQDDKVLEAMRLGVPYEQAKALFPNSDSWLTSIAKGSLALNNYIGDQINEWKPNNDDFASQVAEGTGSSLGFMGAGYGASALAAAAGAGPLGILLAGILAAGGTEALSESGGHLADAYRQGQYDNGGLAAANKSFGANLLLNSALDFALGPFSKFTQGIRNPYTRYAAGTLGQIVNEALQEPSQKVIEDATMQSIQNGGYFGQALGEEVPNWPEYLYQLAPSVASSSLLTSLITGGAAMANPNIRQNLRDEYRNRNVNIDQTQNKLLAQYRKRQRILQHISDLNHSHSTHPHPSDQKHMLKLKQLLAQTNEQIALYSDSLKPNDYSVAMPQLSDNREGGDSIITTTAGKNRYNSHFKFMEADDLITSHNDDFSINEHYPQERQIRQRENEASKDEVDRIARTLDPMALGDNYNAQNGSPIIGNDNTVLSGNGRVLAIRRAYKHYADKAKSYRQFFIDHARDFGLDPEIARRMNNPVLVRVLDSDTDLAQFANEANTSTIQALSAGELAQSDAQTITKNNIMRLFVPGQKLDDQKGLLSAFVDALPDNQKNDLLTDLGNEKGFSQKAVERVRNAIMAIAYGNNNIINKLTQVTQHDDISKSVSQALRTLAPDFAALVAQGKSSLSIGDDIANAVLRLEQYRRNPSKTVNEQAEQQDLPSFELSPEAELLMRFFHNNNHNPNIILQGLANYAQRARSQEVKLDTGQEQLTLFDDGRKLSKLSLLEDALGATLQQAREWDFKNIQQQEAQPTQVQPTQKQATEQSNPETTALGELERYSDYGGDNSAQEQDIPDPHTPDTEATDNSQQDSQVQHTEQTQQQGANLIRNKPLNMPASSNEQAKDFSFVPAENSVVQSPRNQPVQQQLTQHSENLEHSDISDNTRNSGRQEKLQEDNSNTTEKSNPFNTPADVDISALLSDYAERSDTADNTRNPFAATEMKIKQRVSRGKKATRYFFFRDGQDEHHNPHNNSPEKYSYNPDFLDFDGYIGDINIGIGDNSSVSHVFFAHDNGGYYAGFTDEYGNFIATYDLRNNRFFINEGYEASGTARRIEDDMRRQLGNNPTQEIIRRLVLHKAINAGEIDTVADAASRVYIAQNGYLAKQAGISLLDMAMADHLFIQKINREGDYGARAKTRIDPQMNNSQGNPVFEAQSVISLFKNSDASTLLHEFWHIYLEKVKRLFNAGLLKKNSNLLNDWRTILSKFNLYGIDFSKPLSQADKAKWLNAQEQSAASFEKYFWYANPPEGINKTMQGVFSRFKEWLRNIYLKVSDIFYTNANGRRIHNFGVSTELKQVFDHIFTGSKGYSLNESSEAASSFRDTSLSLDTISFMQSGVSPQNHFFNWLKRLGSKVLHPFYSVAHVLNKPSPADTARAQALMRFSNLETERRFIEAQKPVQRLGLLGRINQSVKNAIASIKGGDYSDITNSPRKNDPQLKLLNALQAFRKLDGARKSAVQEAKQTFVDNLRGLNPNQRDIFNRYRVMQDLLWQIEDMPGSPLPFALDEDSLRKEVENLSRLVAKDSAVQKAVHNEEKTMREINDTFTRYASLLGINMDHVFRNPHYYRHRIIEYVQASRLGVNRGSYSRRNIDVQGLADAELRAVMGRDFFKKRKGSTLDFITDYVQANAEVRMQMMQDIETMKTLLFLKKEFDIIPQLRKKFRIGSEAQQQDQQGTIEFSQEATDNNGESVFDHIPEGHEVVDLAVVGGIQSANSTPENIMKFAVSDFSERTGIPIDRALELFHDTDDDSLVAIPHEVADTLRKLAKKRHRGLLGQAAKDLTTWWKRSVLFTPTRNLKYNFRNFTGDLDALIAGNPRALKKLPQAVKELTAYYLKSKSEGYSASQDLQDYIRMSGELGIQSLNLSAKDAEAILYFIDDPHPATKARKYWIKALTPIRAFFKAEHEFTEWREHLLRFAAFLDYKQQMENNNGKPLNWGASIEDEVMAVKDISERAFKMSNELLGAYDQVSEVGKQLRDMLVPFYSWMEVNMRRTYRLLKNGFNYGYGAQQARQLMLGKAASMPLYALSAATSVSKLLAFTAAIQLFNRFFMADADDDLPDDVKYKPHITLGRNGKDVYYFDRIGAVADVADWFSLDSIALDVKDIASGQQTLGGYFKKILQAPVSKAVNSLNPGLKMPIELAMGRSMYPDIFHSKTIRDPAEYVARSFGLQWPYKAIRGIPHNNAQELSNILLYTSNADEAAYWQTIDKVREFQSSVLDRHFDGFASTKRGRILQRVKQALRFNDGEAVRRFLREYEQADGTKQGLKASMKAMDPLHGLNEKEKAQFLRWLTPSDRKYLRKAQRYYHQLADRFIR